MPSAYVKSLYRSLADEAGQIPIQKPSLKQQFIDWFDNVPEISRVRPYSMIEMERALNTQGRYLSSVLLNLGWRRKRKWTGEGQYARFWLPPEN